MNIYTIMSCCPDCSIQNANSPKEALWKHFIADGCLEDQYDDFSKEWEEKAKTEGHKTFFGDYEINLTNN